jgi:FO synthase
LNDWGGISPLTIDFINPEKPWPHIAQLAERTAAEGYELTERLSVYPEYVYRDEFIDARLAPRLRTLANDAGYAGVH